MRCIARAGFANTTMADIIAESGLSAGSIYSHFTSKLDLVRFASASALSRDQVDFDYELQKHRPYPTPVHVVSYLLSRAFADSGREVVLHIWAESLADRELAAIVRASSERLRDTIAATITPWALARSTDHDAAERKALSTAEALVVVIHGYYVQVGIGYPPNPEHIIRLIGDALVET
jgi:AcrR family transcriptional regulator